MFLDIIHRPTRNIIFVPMYHRHRLLDLVRCSLVAERKVQRRQNTRFIILRQYFLNQIRVELCTVELHWNTVWHYINKSQGHHPLWIPADLRYTVIKSPSTSDIEDDSCYTVSIADVKHHAEFTEIKAYVMEQNTPTCCNGYIPLFCISAAWNIPHHAI
jgi:hypothetical protein